MDYAVRVLKDKAYEIQLELKNADAIVAQDHEMSASLQFALNDQYNLRIQLKELQAALKLLLNRYIVVKKRT